MSKSVKFVLAGAIALASVVACNKEVTSNPNYNPATGEVLTSFVFNVAATNTPITKQTPENTQAIPGTNGFLGIVEGHSCCRRQVDSYRRDRQQAVQPWQHYELLRRHHQRRQEP